MVKKVLSKASNLTAYVVGQRLKQWRDDIRMRRFRSCLDRERDVPHSLEHIPVRTVYLFAEANYQPADLFSGNLALFRATQGEGNDEPYKERYEDPLLGWGRRAMRDIVVHDVPGGHSSMLQEPNVQVLAEQLQIAIDNALAEVAELGT